MSTPSPPSTSSIPVPTFGTVTSQFESSWAILSQSPSHQSLNSISRSSLLTTTQMSTPSRTISSPSVITSPNVTSSITTPSSSSSSFTSTTSLPSSSRSRSSSSSLSTSLPSTSTSSSSSNNTPSTVSPTTSPTTTLASASTSEEHLTTFSSPVIITTTNTKGQIATTAPSAITSLLTSTGSDGGLITVTQVGLNPTLSAENSSGKGSTFFRNTGAIAGVFTLVGLAAATIILWIFFAVRRRRRTRQLEHDAAVSATLAAAGFNRSPLDDDGDGDGSATRRSRYGSPDTGQRSSSGLAIGMGLRSPSGFFEARTYDDLAEFNPYTDYIVQPGEHEGYIPALTPSQYRHEGGSGAERVDFGHSASHSAGSYEPLLASYYRTDPNSPSSPTIATPNDVPPTPPPRNPLRLLDSQSSNAGRVEANETAASSLYSSESSGDDRLDPLLRQRLTGETESIIARDPRDEKDYSRPVLGVRNIPDGVSPGSQESN